MDLVAYDEVSSAGTSTLVAAPRGTRWLYGTPRRGWLFVPALLIAADVAAIVVAILAADVTGLGRGSSLLLLSTLPLWIVAFQAAGLYARDRDLVGHSTVDELPNLLRIATMGAWLFFVALSAVGDRPPVAAVVSFWAAAAAVLPTARIVARAIFRATPAFAQNTVIVGAGTVGQFLARMLLTHPEYRVNLLGFVDGHPRERRDDLDDLTVIGTLDELPELVQLHGIDRVMVAFLNDSHEQLLDLIRTLKDLDVRVDVVPRLFDVIPPRLMSQSVVSIPLLTLPRLRLSRTATIIKRSFDVVIGAAITIAFAPMFGVVALLIKLDSPGPVFFRQLRMGANNRPFWIFKFRTMTANAEQQKQAVEHLNAHAAGVGDARLFKIPGDPRVTRIGRVLRRYSLDEFPQLFNVLKGEMTLIGPRPLVLKEDEHVTAWGRRRLALKPGMTGLWQVSGRYAIPFEEMVKLDYLYVTAWSLMSDCKLLLQTVPLVLRGERRDW